MNGTKDAGIRMNYRTTLNRLLWSIVQPVRPVSDVDGNISYICRSMEVNVIFVFAE